MTLHNVLSLVWKEVANKLDWIGYPAEKSMLLSVFVQSQGQKSNQKHETKKLVEVHNHLHILTMCLCNPSSHISLYYAYACA